MRGDALNYIAVFIVVSEVKFSFSFFQIFFINQ